MRPGLVGGETLFGLKRETNLFCFLWSFVQLRWIDVKCLGHIFVGLNLLGEKTIEDLLSWGINQPVFVSFFCEIRSWHTFSTFVRCVFRAKKHRQKTPSRTAFVYIGRSRADVVGFFWYPVKSWNMSKWGVVHVFTVAIYQLFSADIGRQVTVYLPIQVWNVGSVSSHSIDSGKMPGVLPRGFPRFWWVYW